MIIIGSGLGGLCCGYILSKNGYMVTVLEKNRQIGGCLQTFVRKGVKFETGMHYIGGMDEGEIMHSLFAYFNLLDNVTLSRLDPQAYDIISVGDMRYPFANGREACIETLIRYFPHERPALLKYWGGIGRVVNSSPMSAWQSSGQLSPPSLDLFEHSASIFLRNTVANIRLRQVLAGNSILYAGVKNKTPLYYHAIIRDLYNRSSFRIAGGSDVIARSLARSIEESGGEVIPSSPVCKINCNKSQAVSVTLQSGDDRPADYLVSAIHPSRLMEMLDTELIRPVYRKRVLSLENTVSNFTVYIRFRKDAMPYLNSNFFHLSKDTAWDTTNYTANTWPKSFLYMHLCSSPGQVYADGAVLIAYMDFRETAKWKGSQPGLRGDDYESFKQSKALRLIDALERQMPGTRIRIDSFYASTPLTYLDYTGTESGSTYGILHDSSRPLETHLTHRTKIPNLFIAGQNTYSHGMLGVMMGAIVAAGELLK